MDAKSTSEVLEKTLSHNDTEPGQFTVPNDEEALQVPLSHRSVTKEPELSAETEKEAHASGQASPQSAHQDDQDASEVAQPQAQSTVTAVIEANDSSNDKDSAVPAQLRLSSSSDADPEADTMSPVSEYAAAIKASEHLVPRMAVLTTSDTKDGEPSPPEAVVTEDSDADQSPDASRKLNPFAARPTKARFQNLPSMEIPMDMKQKYTLYVSKLDAGVAILLTSDHFLIEFPAMLLPEATTAGSVVNISVHRNQEAEDQRLRHFMDLQQQILDTYTRKPTEPTIRIKNITQTTVLFELDPPLLNEARVKAIEVYKNDQKIVGGAAVIREEQRRVKLSGLEISTEYEVYIVYVTSSGRLESNRVKVKTHGLEQLQGIRVCFDGFEQIGEHEADNEKYWLMQEMQFVLNQLGASYTEQLSMDNTHLICHPEGIATSHQMRLPGYLPGKKGKYELAVELNIPIVSYDWLRACYRDRRVKQATEYYIRKYPSINLAASSQTPVTQREGEEGATSPSEVVDVQVNDAVESSEAHA